MLRGANRLAVRVVDNPWCNGCQLARWSVKPQPRIPAKPSTGQQEHPSKGERATYAMFRRDNAPMALTGVEDDLPHHGLPPALCFLFLVGNSFLIVSKSLSAFCKRARTWSMAPKTAMS